MHLAAEWLVLSHGLDQYQPQNEDTPSFLMLQAVSHPAGPVLQVMRLKKGLVFSTSAVYIHNVLNDIHAFDESDFLVMVGLKGCKTFLQRVYYRQWQD